MFSAEFMRMCIEGYEPNAARDEFSKAKLATVA